MISASLDTWEGEGGSVVEPPEVPEFELAWHVPPPGPIPGDSMGCRVAETPACPSCEPDELAWPTFFGVCVMEHGAIPPGAAVVNIGDAHSDAPRCAPDHVRHASVGFRLSPAMARVDRIALTCVRWLLALLAFPLEWAAAWRRPRAP